MRRRAATLLPPMKGNLGAGVRLWAPNRMADWRRR